MEKSTSAQTARLVRTIGTRSQDPVQTWTSLLPQALRRIMSMCGLTSLLLTGSFILSLMTKTSLRIILCPQLLTMLPTEEHTISMILVSDLINTLHNICNFHFLDFNSNININTKNVVVTGERNMREVYDEYCIAIFGLASPMGRMNDFSCDFINVSSWHH